MTPSRGAHEGSRSGSTSACAHATLMGRLVAVDDPRLDPLWRAAGGAVAPVLIHVADPVAFFQPLDAANERGRSCAPHPDWHFWPPATTRRVGVPGLRRAAGRLRPAARPATRRDLHRRARRLRVGGPRVRGRDAGTASQPLRGYRGAASRSSAASPTPHAGSSSTGADRIVFGTDSAVDVASCRHLLPLPRDPRRLVRLLARALPPQGRWRISGLGLPDEVLRRVYIDNARRILGLAGQPTDRERPREPPRARGDRQPARGCGHARQPSGWPRRTCRRPASGWRSSAAARRGSWRCATQCYVSPRGWDGRTPSPRPSSRRTGPTTGCSPSRRSGTTTEILDALAVVRGRVPTVAITGDPATPITDAADAVVALGLRGRAVGRPDPVRDDRAGAPSGVIGRGPGTGRRGRAQQALDRPVEGHLCARPR